MADVKQFTLTRHAIERLRERNPTFAKENDWVQRPADKKKATYEYLYGAKEERAFLNNSNFMTMLGEKYGYDNRYTMFIRDNVVFVGVSNDQGSFIVTTLLRDQSRIAHIRNVNVKFCSRSRKVHQESVR